VCKGEVGPGSSPGTDNITGGPGNDILTHGNGNVWFDYSDGKKDLLDCGSGTDSVYANLTIDHYVVALNCEEINAE
jgi:hypothetical protein